ncbi:Zinc finger, C3HC4 type (RING finger) [Musa troglodytarum]|uniref:Zinc finger, C3HC4 type (RING finger) n=1 Tax=Musa troglodytarum TaxID=320322 RepID=A0A9E7FM06_9LILI|nr:Zinc finger, C3HC4 type (RING finger) [Musa troglodytarum]
MSGSGVNDSSFLPPDDNYPGRPAGLAYGLGVSVGILIVVTAALLASYLCTRARTTAANRRSGDDAATPTDLEAGIDEATLASYPKVTYSQAKLEEKGTTAACCSICLSNYKDADVLRRLPDCGHLFHLDCVDPWLKAHPSCPNCRSSPAPSSMPMPLSELVPLARARRSQ